MGKFKKKPDPISERARTLNEQIAALEDEIRRLSEMRQQQEEPAPEPIRATNGPQPKLRSTTRPNGQKPYAPPPVQDPQEPVFEDIQQHPLDQPEAPATPAHYNELGVRKYDLLALFRRFKNAFTAPPASNPKLVSYLAAGSIQGLRPLRYEKRVARNRFILLVIILAAVIWGIIAIIINRR